MTEVPLDVVNIISHATQSRLRSLLEKVSVVAQHRADGGKVRTLAVYLLPDVGEFIPFEDVAQKTQKLFKV